MNENMQNQNSNRQMNRHQRIDARRAARGSHYGGSWIAGVVLVLLGILFLMINMGFSTLNNWWALFILIPAMGALGNAYRAYQEADGQLTVRAKGSLIVGLIFLGLTAAFLFEVNLTFIGPLFIVAAGGYLILKALNSPEN